MQTFAERKRALEKNLGPGKETGGTPNRNESNIFVFIFLMFLLGLRLFQPHA